VLLREKKNFFSTAHANNISSTSFINSQLAILSNNSNVIQKRALEPNAVKALGLSYY
jgi:hypothetical protein